MNANQQIANGWTRKEAEAMDAHISGKVAREWARTEPSGADYRKAERASHPTDRMHDARREAEADAYGKRVEIAGDQVKAIKPQDAAQTRRDGVRQAADAYRANLIAAAPPPPAKPTQSETQARRSSQRM